MQDLDRIYQDNFIKVYRYILSLSGNAAVAEDITQDTFFKAIQKIDSFRGDCSLTTWLCRIARNLYLNQQKRQSNFQNITKHPPKNLYATSAEQELIRQEQTSEILSAIQKLADPYKEVFSLRMFSELPFGEISKIFGKNESWARVTYHRAKLMVKEELKDEYEM